LAATQSQDPEIGNVCYRHYCNVTLYNVDDFIRAQIDTQIDYVQSDVYQFSATVRSILP